MTKSGSLYEVSDEKDAGGSPLVTRIACPEGEDPGFRLQNGALVGIGEAGICLFNPLAAAEPHRERAFESMPAGSWGECTSEVVALFVQKDPAERCLASADREALCPYWTDYTLEVLQTIGLSHPVFVIGESMWAWMRELVHSRSSEMQ